VSFLKLSIFLVETTLILLVLKNNEENFENKGGEKFLGRGEKNLEGIHRKKILKIPLFHLL
jgi:hypothetical protein